MKFLPRKEILSLEELGRLAKVFIGLGVEKIRLTGGEPLVRNNILALVRELADTPGLRELNMTTNGSQLENMAGELKAAGLNRLNISLDSLRADRFKQMTRTGELSKVLRGIDAARAAGFDNIKINAVILNGRNEDEILDLVEFCITNQLDISFIEEMPLGLIDEHDRAITYLSSDKVRERIAEQYALNACDETTAGPSVYFKLRQHPIKIGFISPHSHNFCHLCNRVRLTVEGRLLLCLGNEHSCDLRDVLRSGANDDELRATIVNAMDLKPERHHFDLEEEPQIVRFMNMTGG